MECAGNSSNDNKLHLGLAEYGQRSFEISHALDTSGRNLVINLTALVSCSARSSVVSLRFRSTSVQSMSRLKTSSTGSTASALKPSYCGRAGTALSMPKITPSPHYRQFQTT